jgi:hypothetical protein
LKSSIVSELPIEFRAFDGRHQVFVCDKDAGFKQAIPLIRRLLLIAVGHWSTWSKEAFLSRDKLGADRLLLPHLILAHGRMAKWQRHRAIRKRKREERYEFVRGRDAQRLPGVKDAHCMKN